MRYTVKEIGIHVLAFLVARCQLLEMYPFVVPFFMGAYIQQKSSFGMYLIMMIGLLTKMQWENAIRYSLILCFMMVMLKKTDRRYVFANNYQISLASGVVLWAVSVPYQYLLTGKDEVIAYALLEGVIAACFILLFEQGFLAMHVGISRMFCNNERFIGFFAILIVALCGCPLINNPVNLLFCSCSVLLLLHSYRFESSVAMTTGAVTGMVLSLRLENVNYLAIMILLSGIMVLLKDLGKVGILIGYLAGCIIMGIGYETQLMEPGMLLGTLVSAVLFWIVPAKWMKTTQLLSKWQQEESKDFMLQETTRMKLREFGQAFCSMEKMLQSHQEQCQELNLHGLSNIYLSGDGISLLNVVESQSNRLEDLRKNFIRQIGQIGEVITKFPSELENRYVTTGNIEERIAQSFETEGVWVKNVAMMREPDHRIKLYVRCNMSGEQLVTGKRLAEKVSRLLGKTMACVDKADELVSGFWQDYCFVEKGKFVVTTGAVRRNRKGETVCGDNFTLTKISPQKALFMLSDGMGSGERANDKSSQVVELLEQLLRAGFPKELAVEMLNSFLSFFAEGALSTSVDLGIFDMYNGELDLIKLGASTTFIKRRDKVECIRSTSLPVGVLEQVEFDTCSRKIYHGDMIVMVSDGILDSVIFEDKEAYFADVLTNYTGSNAQALAEYLMVEVERMQRDGMKDDGTILAVGVWKQGE